MANTADAITAAYQQYLGRAPSADEVAWHLNDTGNSTSIIANSPEAQARASSAAAPAAAATNNGPDSSSLTNFANQFTSGYQSLLAGQDAQQQGLFDQYTQAVNAQTKLPDLYTQLSTQLGIPDISQNITGYKDQIYRVQGLLDRLDDDINSRVSGTYTNEALRDRMSAQEGGDLRTQLGRLGTGLQPFTDQMTAAQGQIATLLPLYEQQQEKDLSPLEMQINSLSDKFARQITGYTTENQQQLTAILDNLQRQRQLSDRDWQAAQDLATQERDYEHNLALAKASATGSNYFTSSAGGSTAAGSTATPLAQLPSLSASLLPVYNPQSTGGISLQGSPLQLQGGGNVQGGGFSLQ